MSIVPMKTANKTPMPPPITALIIVRTTQLFMKSSCKAGRQNGSGWGGGDAALDSTACVGIWILTEAICSAVGASSRLYVRRPGGRCDWSPAGGLLLAGASGISDASTEAMA